LHSFQDTGLDLSLLRTGLANHGNKDGRTIKALGKIVATPSHGVSHAEFADLFDIGRSEVIFAFRHGLVNTGEIIGIYGRSRGESGCSADIVGRQEFRWGMVYIGGTGWRVVDNVIVILLGGAKGSVWFDT
jgi:hypothetical protein